MKRAPLDSSPDLARLASDLQEATRSPGPRRHPLLLERLAEAARQGDRPEFDRLFDRCFERVYAIAWRVAGDRARAEAITTHILCEAALEAAHGRR